MILECKAIKKNKMLDKERKANTTMATRKFTKNKVTKFQGHANFWQQAELLVLAQVQPHNGTHGTADCWILKRNKAA